MGERESGLLRIPKDMEEVYGRSSSVWSLLLYTLICQPSKKYFFLYLRSCKYIFSHILCIIIFCTGYLYMYIPVFDPLCHEVIFNSTTGLAPRMMAHLAIVAFIQLLCGNT